MEPTIDIRKLLREYDEAVAARDEAEAIFDAEEKAEEREIFLRQVDGGGGRTSEEVQACNERLDAHVERWHDPVDRAVGKLRAAVLILHGANPFSKFDRPRAVAIDGVVLCTTNRDEDPEMHGLVVARDVRAISAPPPADPKSPRRRKSSVSVEVRTTPAPAGSKPLKRPNRQHPLKGE